MIEHSDSDARLRTKKNTASRISLSLRSQTPMHDNTLSHKNTYKLKKNTPNQKQKCDSPSATWSGTSSTTRIAGTADPSRRTGNTCT